MSNKALYISIAALLLLMLGYEYFLSYMKKLHPEYNWNPQPQQIQQAPSTQTSTAIPTTTPSTNSSISPATAPASGLTVVGANDVASPPLPLLGSTKPHDPTVPMALQFVPGSDGLQSVTLNEANAMDNPKELYQFQLPYTQDDIDVHALATQQVVVDGQSLGLSGVHWQASKGTDTESFFITIDDHGKPILKITKAYELQPRTSKSDANGPDGYQVVVDYHVENLSRVEHTVRLVFDGPTMPPREIERSDDRQIVAAFDKGNQTLDIQRLSPSEFKPESNQRDLIRNDKNYPLLWVAATSVYFSAVVQPAKPSQFDAVDIWALNPDAKPDDRLVAMDFKTADLSVSGKSAVDVPMEVFFGPKRRPVLENDYYSDYPREYSELLRTSSSFCGICAFPWLVDRLIDLLRVFHFVLRDWGLAIIALVVCVRLILHPITKSSQVSMLKMQKMGPELERLKKKYGDDKEAFAKAQMGIYKEMGITPVLGCLPMVLQMPIWIALYTALQSEFALRQAPFLWGWTWIHDLARPDRLISWENHAFTVPVLGMKIVSLNVLPILLAVVFFVQQKTQPQLPAQTPEQESQRKMMQWMSLLFPIFLYTAPSGLNLYILTSTTIGIFESKRIRDHIKQRQEREAEMVKVETKPTRAAKQKRKQDKLDSTRKEPVKQGWWASLQQRVEQMRQDAERKARGE